METNKSFGEKLLAAEQPGTMDPGERIYAKGGGKETLYRVTIRSQIRLIGILDSKANLVISINTLLITGVLGLLTGSLFFWQPSTEWQISQQFPFISFLIFSLATMYFAIMSTRTDLAIKKFEVMKSASPIQMTLTHQKKFVVDEYLDFMDEILKSNKRIYEVLNLDLYFLSRVVSRKSKYLNIAYSLFIIGLAVGVGLFFVLTLYQKTPV